jgi:hypothetical protein
VGASCSSGGDHVIYVTTQLVTPAGVMGESYEKVTPKFKFNWKLKYMLNQFIDQELTQFCQPSEPNVSNLSVGATYNGVQVIFNVTFNDQSKSRCFFTYQLEFDGQTKVVSSGDTVVTEVTGSCTNLTFVLTRLLMGQPWGPSSLYQIPVGGEKKTQSYCE